MGEVPYVLNYRFLTTQQAAEFLLVESKSIRRWLKDGKLKGYKLPGGDWCINLEDLESVLQTPAGGGEEISG